ncbi:hypothetical protein GCM10009681_15340 [Luedemannella helvata]|uniref:Uncharacterized protein n=1 Tax=Luedemannella helvata TaxID=349315 RepID=A0ABP4W1W4_9ACTN
MPQLGHVTDPLLEQVGASGGAGFEKPAGPLGLDVLGQHDDPEFRMAAGQRLGRPDALVVVVGPHPHIGDHRIGTVCLDRRQQRLDILNRGDQLDAAVGAQHRAQRLPDQEAVLSHDDPNRHGRSPYAVLTARHAWRGTQ